MLMLIIIIIIDIKVAATSNLFVAWRDVDNETFDDDYHYQQQFFGLVDICISIFSSSDHDDDKDDDDDEEEDVVDYTWCIRQRTRHITTKLTQKL